MKLGDKFLVLRLEGKVLATIGETRVEEKLLERGCLLLVTIKKVLLLLVTLHRTEYFPQLQSFPPCSRIKPWSKHLFSPTNIPQLDRAGSFISRKGLDIQASTPLLHPWYSVSVNVDGPPLWPRFRYDPQPLHNLLVTNLFPPHPSLKLLSNSSQPTQITAPLQPVSLPPISTLPEDAPEPELQSLNLVQAHVALHHEPEPEQHEPEPEQKELETPQQSELEMQKAETIQFLRNLPASYEQLKQDLSSRDTYQPCTNPTYIKLNYH